MLKDVEVRAPKGKHTRVFVQTFEAKPVQAPEDWDRKSARARGLLLLWLIRADQERSMKDCA
jgi:hypothetical protein